MVALSAMARVTSRVQLGPACLNPFMVHPVEIAAQAALLDSISEGRSFLGLARGAWLEPLGIAQGPTAVAEAAELVAMLLRDDCSGFLGAHFRLPPGVGLEQRGPRSSIPLIRTYETRSR
jgi:5,10-methylenetetrahydromethanopterin reductase